MIAWWHPELRRRGGPKFVIALPGLALIAWRVHTPAFWPDLLSENQLIEQAFTTHSVLNGYQYITPDRVADFGNLNLLKAEVQMYPERFALDFTLDKDTKTYHWCDKGVHCGLFQLQHKALDRLVALADPLIDAALRRLSTALVKIVAAYFRPLHLRCARTCPYLPEEWARHDRMYVLPEYTMLNAYYELAGADPNFGDKYRQLYEQRQARILRIESDQMSALE